MLALRCKNEKNEKCDKNIKQSDLSGEKWKKISYFVRIVKIRSRQNRFECLVARNIFLLCFYNKFVL